MKSDTSSTSTNPLLSSSFGSSSAPKVVKNPLLSAAVTNLTFDDFQNQPLLLPPAPPPVVTSPIVQAIASVKDSTPTATVGKTPEIDTNTLSEINLNSSADDENENPNAQEFQDDGSILSQAASSFSQLPSVASTVFSSFSRKIKDYSPNINDNNGNNPGPELIHQPTPFDANLNVPQIPAEPPKFYSPEEIPTVQPGVASAPPPISGNNYRFAGKRKTYAPIPGLTSNTPATSAHISPSVTPVLPPLPEPQVNDYQQPPPQLYPSYSEPSRVEEKKGGLFSNIKGFVQTATDTLTGRLPNETKSTDFFQPPPGAETFQVQTPSYFPQQTVGNTQVNFFNPTNEGTSTFFQTPAPPEPLPTVTPQSFFGKTPQQTFFTPGAPETQTFFNPLVQTSVGASETQAQTFFNPVVEQGKQGLPFDTQTVPQHTYLFNPVNAQQQEPPSDTQTVPQRIQLFNPVVAQQQIPPSDTQTVPQLFNPVHSSKETEQGQFQSTSFFNQFNVDNSETTSNEVKSDSIVSSAQVEPIPPPSSFNPGLTVQPQGLPEIFNPLPTHSVKSEATGEETTESLITRPPLNNSRPPSTSSVQATQGVTVVAAPPTGGAFVNPQEISSVPRPSGPPLANSRPPSTSSGQSIQTVVPPPTSAAFFNPQEISSVPSLSGPPLANSRPPSTSSGQAIQAVVPPPTSATFFNPQEISSVPSLSGPSLANSRPPPTSSGQAIQAVVPPPTSATFFNPQEISSVPSLSGPPLGNSTSTLASSVQAAQGENTVAPPPTSTGFFNPQDTSSVSSLSGPPCASSRPPSINSVQTPGFYNPQETPVIPAPTIPGAPQGFYNPQETAAVSEHNIAGPPLASTALPPTRSTNNTSYRLQKGTRLYKSPFQAAQQSAPVQQGFYPPSLPHQSSFLPPSENQPNVFETTGAVNQAPQPTFSQNQVTTVGQPSFFPPPLTGNQALGQFSNFSQPPFFPHPTSVSQSQTVETLNKPPSSTFEEENKFTKNQSIGQQSFLPPTVEGHFSQEQPSQPTIFPPPTSENLNKPLSSSSQEIKNPAESQQTFFTPPTVEDHFPQEQLSKPTIFPPPTAENLNKPLSSSSQEVNKLVEGQQSFFSPPTTENLNKLLSNPENQFTNVNQSSFFPPPTAGSQALQNPSTFFQSQIVENSNPSEYVQSSEDVTKTQTVEEPLPESTTVEESLQTELSSTASSPFVILPSTGIDNIEQSQISEEPQRSSPFESLEETSQGIQEPLTNLTLSEQPTSSEPSKTTEPAAIQSFFPQQGFVVPPQETGETQQVNFFSQGADTHFFTSNTSQSVQIPTLPEGVASNFQQPIPQTNFFTPTSDPQIAPPPIGFDLVASPPTVEQTSVEPLKVAPPPSALPTSATDTGVNPFRRNSQSKYPSVSSFFAPTNSPPFDFFSLVNNSQTQQVAPQPANISSSQPDHPASADHRPSLQLSSSEESSQPKINISDSSPDQATSSITGGGPDDLNSQSQSIQNFFNNPPPQDVSDSITGDLNYNLVGSSLQVNVQTRSLTPASNLVEPPSSSCSEFSELNSSTASALVLDNTSNKTSPNEDLLPEDIVNELKMANLKEGEGALAEITYSPAKIHWFYNRLSEGKHCWIPFTKKDSDALEQNFSLPGGSNVIPVESTRYDVNISERTKTPAYWAGDKMEVRRCSWFFKGSDTRYYPYDEPTSALLEEEYRMAALSGEWHKKVNIPSGETVVFHAPTVIVHFQQSQTTDNWGGSSQTTTRPRVVKRDLDEFNIEEGEPDQVDHLLVIVHGIGAVCDLKFRTIEEVVDEFRTISLQLVQSHYKNSTDSGHVGRVEVLPISWYGELHSEEMGIDEKLKAITLESIPKLRNFTNDTLLDILFYTSPVYCQKIMNSVSLSINNAYKAYSARNPSFHGGVSLAGHSLGSLILFDLLCHQKPVDFETNKENPDQIVNTQSNSSTVSYTMGPAGTGQPFISYPQLVFQPKKFFALGSPIGVFVTVRGIDKLGLDFRLPTCPGFYNIFHPYDPVAYRIEALINPDLKDCRPVLIPHHKGRKRMHLELKETMSRVGQDIKQKLMDTFKNIDSFGFLNKKTNSTSDQNEIESEVDKVLEMQMQMEETPRKRIDSTSTVQSDIDTGEVDFPLGKLNDSKRVDYVLQEAPLEFFNEYIFALSSHVCYWDSADTILFVMKEIYNHLGISPDSQVPQQTMTIENDGEGAASCVSSRSSCIEWTGHNSQEKGWTEATRQADQ